MSDLSDPRLVKRASAFASRTEEPQAEAPLRRRASLGFAGAILLTMLLGFLSLYNARKAAEDAAWVDRTHEASGTLELTLRHLDDVETGGRGFALTGDESFLEPYETGKRRSAATSKH